MASRGSIAKGLLISVGLLLPSVAALWAAGESPKHAAMLNPFGWLVAAALLFVVVESALIAGLLVNRKKRIRGEQEASLIADLSSKFINLPAGEVDREIMEAERQICESLGIDLASFWQWSDQDGGCFMLTHQFSLEGGAQSEGRMKQEDFPYCFRELLAGRIVAASSLDKMPPEASKDCEVARQFGIKSSLNLPVSVGGLPSCLLCLNTTRAERDWPDEFVKRAQLIGQIFANATARKRADQALQESQLRLRMTSDAAGAGLWVLEWESGEFWANETARSMFGFTADERIDMVRFEASVFPMDWPRVEEALSNSVKTGVPVDVEYRIRLGDGTEKWIVSRGRPFLKVDGAPERLLGLSMDITGQRKAEMEAVELRDTLAHSGRVSLLGHLASSLAHELSQPLGAILRNAEAADLMLGMPSPDLEELRAIVTDIRHDDRRAGEVINHLRSLLKHGSLDSQPLVMAEVVGEVLSLVRADATARHVRLESSIAPELPLVLGDRIHLQQVMINLLVNAMDALDDVGPDQRLVRVTVRRSDAAAVEVEVTDTGPGIPKEHLPRLFEPFFTTKSAGMGIGLPVSRTIIEAHKGKLWAENDPAGGARFHFTVPVS